MERQARWSLTKTGPRWLMGNRQQQEEDTGVPEAALVAAKHVSTSSTRINHGHRTAKRYTAQGTPVPRSARTARVYLFNLPFQGFALGGRTWVFFFSRSEQKASAPTQCHRWPYVVFRVCGLPRAELEHDSSRMNGTSASAIMGVKREIFKILSAHFELAQQTENSDSRRVGP